MDACSSLPSPWPDVRLWQVDLERDARPEGLCLLSASEHARAQRFVFEPDRQRYLRAHAALHMLLDAALPDQHRQDTEFELGPWGKPRLRHARHLHFNLSHSGARALVAISTNAEVGVDVEVLRTVPEMAELAQMVFSSSEHAQWASTPSALRELTFLRCWTRKEAVVKALGNGLLVDLPTIDVGTGCDNRRVLVETAAGEQAALDLRSLALPSGAVGALARRAAVEPIGQEQREKFDA